MLFHPPEERQYKTAMVEQRAKPLKNKIISPPPSTQTYIIIRLLPMLCSCERRFPLPPPPSTVVNNWQPLPTAIFLLNTKLDISLFVTSRFFNDRDKLKTIYKGGESNFEMLVDLIKRVENCDLQM